MHKRFKVAIVVCGIAFVAVLFLLSPFFYITEVTVNGNEIFTNDELIKKAGVVSTSNLLLFNTGEARRRMMESTYIDQVSFQRELPNHLIITVRERHLSGYVEYMQGNYLYIDENGRILEINSFFTEKLPVVSGLKFTRIRLGELLEVDDTSAFKTVVTYARLLNKHNINELVSRIDVSESENARVRVHNIEFNVGDGKNADEKVRTIIEIVNNLPNAEIIKGFVDLREIREKYFLKILV